jgi:hypothetical protein
MAQDYDRCLHSSSLRCARTKFLSQPAEKVNVILTGKGFEGKTIPYKNKAIRYIHRQRGLCPCKRRNIKILLYMIAGYHSKQAAILRSSAQRRLRKKLPDRSLPKRIPLIRKNHIPCWNWLFQVLFFPWLQPRREGLGSIPNPQTNLTVQSLPTAKEMIDILGILKEKTKGNLTTEEQALFDSILFNIRMQYVRAIDDRKKEDKK